jgi:hypothetical protein
MDGNYRQIGEMGVRYIARDEETVTAESIDGFGLMAQLFLRASDEGDGGPGSRQPAGGCCTDTPGSAGDDDHRFGFHRVSFPKIEKFLSNLQ